MTNPYFTRKAETKEKGRIGGAGRLAEKKLAKKLGGRLTPGSGNQKKNLADIELGPVRIEAKSTKNASLSVQYAWFIRISKEAKGKKKTPVVTLSFTDEEGNPRMFGEWACIPLSEFQRMIHEPD